MRKKHNVIIIPDAYLGNSSGAIVAQVAKRLLQELHYEISIFSCDITTDCIEPDGTKLYHRTGYNGLSNWKEKQYIKEYVNVLDQSEASIIFTIGSITNKNICYLEIAKKLGLRIIAKIFMQDFFCTKFYANDLNGPCTKCLDNNYIEAYKNKCIIDRPIDYLKTASAILIRKRLQKILPEIDCVIGSTDEQIGFYQKFGIPKEKCIKTPLYFDRSRLKEIQPKMGDYFVCIAQNRIEKGFHLLPAILQNCDQSIKIIAAYNKKEQANKAIDKYGFQTFIERGMLEIIPEVTWETGLASLVAESRGVIIPSVWPTTTEFVLLEALGYKKPVFTFDVGIHHEIIRSGINGFTVPLGHYSLISDQLKQIMTDDNLYKQVSQNSGALFEQLTNWENWKRTLQGMGL